MSGVIDCSPQGVESDMDQTADIYPSRILLAQKSIARTRQPVVADHRRESSSASVNSDKYSDAEEELPAAIKRHESGKLLPEQNVQLSGDRGSYYGETCVNRHPSGLSKTADLDGLSSLTPAHHEELSAARSARLEIMSVCSRAAEQAEEFVHKVWEAGWRVVHHRSLPNWLRDNEFLHSGHRPPTNSFWACFKSIFKIHTETGNIWTHLLGMIAFVGIATYFLTRPSVEIQWQEKAVFSAFFAGAILCLGFSWIFHTVYCHSEKVGKLFNKLDYCGIALLTMGSFVPWLYYSFYCRIEPKIAYLVLIFVLGTCCIVVSLWDKFSQPEFRVVRAGMFIGLGLSGVIPALHYVITDGFYHAINKASLGWLVLMAFLYIAGAVIYAVRIPERLFPGKFDIWSHQIFHVFVVAAAFVHYHGISEIANYRLTLGDCLDTELE